VQPPSGHQPKFIQNRQRLSPTGPPRRGRPPRSVLQDCYTPIWGCRPTRVSGLSPSASRALAGLDLDELSRDVEPFRAGEARESFSLCLSSQARSALPDGRDPEVGHKWSWRGRQHDRPGLEYIPTIRPFGVYRRGPGTISALKTEGGLGEGRGACRRGSDGHARVAAATRSRKARGSNNHD
jgi:hypothetical protein